MPKKTLEQLQKLWGRLSAQQRTVILGGVLATVLALSFLVRAMLSPSYQSLMTGMEPEDVQTVSQQLSAKKIEFRLTPDGRGVEVPADKIDQARIEIATQGATHSGRMGFELFDKSSWGQTEFDEKVNYQRALEGELERTIGTLRAVKSARVHLVLPKDSVFLDRERSAKASVTLRLRRGNLSQDELDAISRLVSGAVEDLSPNDVSIIDADRNQPLRKHAGSPEGDELEAELTQRLMATLGPAVGPDNLRATVDVAYDPTSSEESQEKYDPTVTALLTTQKTHEQVGAGVADGGVAGTASNLPATATNSSSTQDASVDTTAPSNSSSENSTFGVNKIARHTVSPAGRIKRITAAILVNDFSDKKMVGGKLVGSTYKRSPAQMKQLENLATAALGLDPQRGDVVTVENMTFYDGAGAVDSLSVMERVQTAVRGSGDLLRYAGLLGLFALAWLLLFRPVQKQFAATLKSLSAPASVPGAVDLASTPGLAVEPVEHLLEADMSTVDLKRRLSEMVETEPAAMTRTVQAWLQEGEA